MSQEVRILGIDAAFANTGYALCRYVAGNILVDDLQLAETVGSKADRKVVRRNSDDLRRAGEVIAMTDQIIQSYKPQLIVCEIPTSGQDARAAWCLGIAVGLIAHAASRVPLIQVSPGEVKSVVGEKFPDKAQMIAWGVSKYPTAPWPVRGERVVAKRAEHMADAIAAVHAGVKTDEFRRAAAFAGWGSGLV